MGTTYPLITISGPPASGTSTLSKELKKRLGFELVNGGDIFRQIAADRDVSVGELNEYAKTTDKIDRELDTRLKEIITDHLAGKREPAGDGLIVESRLAAWHANGKATLSIYLTAPLEIRAERLSQREENADELRQRQESEKQRYNDYYGIDLTDKSVYDTTISTKENSVEETIEKALLEFKTREQELSQT